MTELPTEAQQVVIPTTQTWPRTSFAVSVQPENLQTPRLSVLEQDTARGDYQLWAWVRLLPGVTMPSFADPSIGSEDVAPDDSSLLVTPTDAVAQYADVLNLGGDPGSRGPSRRTRSARCSPSARRTGRRRSSPPPAPTR